MGGMVSQHALQVVSHHALQKCVSSIMSTRGWYPSMHCRWYPSMPCRYPGGLQAHTQGEAEGSGGGGGVSRPTPRGVSRPTSRRGCVSQHALTPPHGRLLPRAVRILLECILVCADVSPLHSSSLRRFSSICINR